MIRKIVIGLAALAGLALAAIIAVGVVIWISFSRTRPIVDGAEVAPGIVCVKEGFVSSFIVDAGRGKVVLVDAGIDPAAARIVSALSSRRLGPESVEAILLTHGHTDHVAGCAAFPKAAVCSLEPDVALAEGRARSGGPLGWLRPAHPTGVKVTRILHDGETVRFGTAVVRVFAVPGHTAGSAAFLVRGALFLGDSADSLKSGRLAGAKWIFSQSLAQNRASLRSLAARLKPGEVKTLVFAHSGPLPGLEPLLDYAAGR